MTADDAAEKARIAAVVGDCDITFSLTEALFMAEEIDRLRARIVVLEAGGVRTEWAVGDPEDCATDYDVREVDGPPGLTQTDRHYGRKLLARTVYVGAWRLAPGGAS